MEHQEGLKQNPSHHFKKPKAFKKTQNHPLKVF